MARYAHHSCNPCAVGCLYYNSFHHALLVRLLRRQWGAAEVAGRCCHADAPTTGCRCLHNGRDHHQWCQTNMLQINAAVV